MCPKRKQLVNLRISFQRISLAILGTPGSVGMQASQDLSEENLEDEVVDIPKASPAAPQSASARSSKSSLGSIDSIASTKSYPGRVVKRRSSDRKYNGKKILSAFVSHYSFLDYFGHRAVLELILADFYLLIFTPSPFGPIRFILVRFDSVCPSMLWSNLIPFLAF